MVVSKDEVELVRALAKLRALAECCHRAVDDLDELGASLVDLLREPEEWLQAIRGWSFAERDHDKPNPRGYGAYWAFSGGLIHRFCNTASKPQIEKIIDAVVPIYLHGIRTFPNRCVASREAEWNRAIRVLEKNEFYTVVDKDPKLDWRNALQRARTLTQLEKARIRAAERTYAPGQPGMREAAAAFHDASA